jgi:hypothetical protein
VRVRTRSKKQLEALGVAVLGGSVNRRSTVLVALVDVAALIQQQLEALGVAVEGGLENRRNAVVVALVDVAARSFVRSFLLVIWGVPYNGCCILFIFGFGFGVRFSL